MGAKPRKRYAVYDKETGELVTKGTARSCSEATGLTVDAIYQNAAGSANHSQYVVEELYDECVCDSIEAAARAWDKFCEPIRKKYGIPVYKAPAKEGKA